MERRIARERLERARIECSPHGVVALFVLARLSSLIDGLPSSVGLSVAGIHPGLRAFVESGVWRLDAPVTGTRSMSLERDDVAHVLAGVAVASGIPWNDRSGTILAGMLSVGPEEDFVDVWNECVDRLPRHVACASIAFGGRLARVFGLDGDPLRSEAGVEAIRDRGLSPLEELPDGKGPPILRLERESGPDALDVLLEAFPPAAGNAVSGRLVHRFAREHDPEMLEVLERRGADFGWRDADGRNALHAALSGALTRIQAAKRTMTFLIDRGVDRDGTDLFGATAGATFGRYVEDFGVLDDLGAEDVACCLRVADLLGVEISRASPVP